MCINIYYYLSTIINSCTYNAYSYDFYSVPYIAMCIYKQRGRSKAFYNRSA